MKEENSRVYTPSFVLLCLSAFLFFASFNMLIPELPAYLSRLGGAEYKGFIIGLFTITAGLSRPVSGKLADKVGRIPVMIIGASVCFVCGFLYPVLSSVAGFLLLRLVHGISTGFTPTGNSAYAADIIPDSRRGEAIGFLGLCGSSGMALGPAIGSMVANAFSVDVMFYTSSLASLLSVLLLSGLKETVKDKVPFHWRLLTFSRHEFFEPRVIAPTIVIILSSFAFGAVLTLTPDQSEFLNMGNKGLFFLCFTLASLGFRFIAGKISDKYGRVIVLKVSTALITISMVMAGFAYSPTSFLATAIVFGVAQGMNSPTLSAWTIDLSIKEHRGRALSTMYIGLEIGIGLGAFISGALYGNNAARLPYAFWFTALVSALAFVYLQFGIHSYKPRITN
jgi:MFS family permease